MVVPISLESIPQITAQKYVNLLHFFGKFKVTGIQLLLIGRLDASLKYKLTSGQVWYNKCNGGGAGGDDDNTNPNLPPYTPGKDTCPATDLELCTLIPGICEIPDHHLPDIPLPPPGTPPDRTGDFKLARRAGDSQKNVPLGNNIRMRLIFLAYPAWEEFLGLRIQFPGRVLRRFWRFVARECEGDPVETGEMALEDPELPEGIGLESEHIIDVSLHHIFQILI